MRFNRLDCLLLTAVVVATTLTIVSTTLIANRSKWRRRDHGAQVRLLEDDHRTRRNHPQGTLIGTSQAHCPQREEKCRRCQMMMKFCKQVLAVVTDQSPTEHGTLVSTITHLLRPTTVRQHPMPARLSHAGDLNTLMARMRITASSTKLPTQIRHNRSQTMMNQSRSILLLHSIFATAVTPRVSSLTARGTRYGWAIQAQTKIGEEEETLLVSTPRSIRAARRSAFRGAFHLTLLFFLTVIVPGEATDTFVTPSIPTATFPNFHNATLLTCSIASHGSTLHLLNFSWILVTWLDVLHGLCFGVLVTFTLFASLALCVCCRTTETKNKQVSTRTHKSVFSIGTAVTASSPRLASVRLRPYI
jgi:hypothetical protein